jgi:hypothetical protein
MEDALILLAIIVVGGILILPRVAKARIWRATTTPLASIIGSGFLVLGPVLNDSYEVYAPLVMAGLCAVAYLFGSAIRFNIAVFDHPEFQKSAAERRMETAASWTLAFAYVISVAYYLNLFGSFGVSLSEPDDALDGRLLTSATFFLILVVGWTRGFGALERMEQISVGIKLAIIAGLLVGLIGYFVQQADAGKLLINPPRLTGWPGITLAFGLIVTVQGFETSRYLAAEYSAETRIRSMRIAQFLSAAIYMIYIGLLAFLFPPKTVPLNETAIIDMMGIVTPILPVLLIAAALSAQFSAAVADTNGSGGLIAELSRDRISPRVGYTLLVATGLLLTWTADVFEIISYASRAFALYYALQSAIAASVAWHQPGRRGRSFLYMALTILGAAVTIFGTPAE